MIQKFIGLLSLSLMAQLTLGFGANAQVLSSTCESTYKCTSVYKLSNGEKLELYSNYRLDQHNANLNKVLFVIHGSSRNGMAARDALSLAINGRNAKTLIIAPRFKAISAGDTSTTYPLDHAEWGSEGWIKGNVTKNKTGTTRLSSFSVMDHLISSYSASSYFPGIKSATLVGHSAGGQFTQRYALASKINPSNLAYVVVNPGNLTYLNAYRPSGSVNDPSFSIPLDCSGYDIYKYGLTDKDITTYLRGRTTQQLITQYLARDVTYLIGQNDVYNTPGLNTSCKAQKQGDNRYERSKYFFAHLNKYFANNSHRFFEVPNVGHSSLGMYGSEQGLASLFPPNNAPVAVKALTVYAVAGQYFDYTPSLSAFIDPDGDSFTLDVPNLPGNLTYASGRIYGEIWLARPIDVAIIATDEFGNQGTAMLKITVQKRNTPPGTIEP
ncbi:MAG: Ig domain-containing protein [Gammaproteobacteria bacterium]|nr:Ig domain-containing protein [Gammaproteobacteria bacterium]